MNQWPDFARGVAGFGPDYGPTPALSDTADSDPNQTLALPKEVEHWSLTTLREKLVKIGAKVVRHGEPAKIGLSDGFGGKTITTAAQSEYDRHGFEDYLGNVDVIAAVV